MCSSLACLLSCQVLVIFCTMHDESWLCAKHQTITNFLNSNSNQGGKQNTKTKQKNKKNATNKLWILSLFGFVDEVWSSQIYFLKERNQSRSSSLWSRNRQGIAYCQSKNHHRNLSYLQASQLSWKDLLFLVKESQLANQRIIQESQLCWVRNLCLYRQGISSSWWRNLSLLLKESSMNLGDRQGISAYWSTNHPGISAIGKESQLTDQRIIQESLLLSSRNLLLLTEESPLADQRIIE